MSARRLLVYSVILVVLAGALVIELKPWQSAPTPPKATVVGDFLDNLQAVGKYSFKNTHGKPPVWYGYLAFSYVSSSVASSTSSAGVIAVVEAHYQNLGFTRGPHGELCIGPGSLDGCFLFGDSLHELLSRGARIFPASLKTSLQTNWPRQGHAIWEVWGTRISLEPVNP